MSEHDRVGHQVTVGLRRGQQIVSFERAQPVAPSNYECAVDLLNALLTSQ